MRPEIGKREMIVIGVALLLIISIAVYFVFIRDIGSDDIVDDDQDRKDNRKPVADAGLDQAIVPGEPAILDATGSYDDDNDVLFFKWDIDSGVDSNNDGINDNDWVINGELVEWTYPAPDEMITYIVTVNVSDGESWSTDTSQVTIYLQDEETIPEVTLSCNYQQEIPYISSRFIVTVEEVSSYESIFNYSYLLEDPEGEVLSNGTLASLVPTGPNSTEIAFIDTPGIGDLDSLDTISLREGAEIVEGCYLTLYYKDEREPVGEVELTK